MRKGAGISALSRHTATASSYASLSSTLSSQQLTQLETQLASFREALVSFAAAHRADIRKDPAFRHQFQKMCSALGIDPLAGGNGRPAWWAESLGLGEWSAELALQVVDVCVSTREANGGVIEMGELIARVEAMRRGAVRAVGAGAGAVGAAGAGATSTSVSTSTSTGAGTGAVAAGFGSRIFGGLSTSSPPSDAITPDDVRRALDLLRPLRAGYTLHEIGGVTFVRSVPRELDMDQSMLLVLASDARPRGALTEGGVARAAGWSAVRARTALEDAVMREGIGWVDEQGGERTVWLLAAVEFAD